MLQPHFHERNPALALFHHLEAVPGCLLVGQRKSVAAGGIDMKFEVDILPFHGGCQKQAVFHRNVFVRIRVPDKCPRRLFRHKILQGNRVSLFLGHIVPKQTLKGIHVRVLAACNDRITQDQTIRTNLCGCSADRIIYQLIVPEYAKTAAEEPHTMIFAGSTFHSAACSLT